MGFEVAIVGILILFCIYAGFHYYQLNKENHINNLIETFNTMNEEEEIKADKIDWNITQHIGWLYKNGTNKNFDNLNLYFNQSDASFFATNLNDQTKIQMNREMMKDGDEVMVNNGMYVVKMFTEEE